MVEQMNQQHQEQFGKQVEHFNQVVNDLIPDWSEDVALANRKFALDFGLDQNLVDTMVDPMMVKAIDNLRRLSENLDKGTAKRKKTPVKRVPTKKPVAAKTKKSNRVDAARKNVSKGRATEQDSKVLFDNVIDGIFDS